ERVSARYAIGVTGASAALIDPADPRDPIALQFLPQEAELHRAPDEADDPIGDVAKSPLPGLVHRYPDRVLLMPTHVCASYCRFCFRRERVGPGKADALSPEALDAALAYIAARPAIWEVILTGGDPLALSARRIEALARRLAAIDHVKVMRVHTRVPAVAPERITPALVRALKASDKALFVALHANHPRELTPEARAACARLIDAGVVMLSQSVLLRGVNDDPEVLAELMRAFVETRIRPYYLHQGDAAPGTAHLRVPLAEGREVVRRLRGRVSGLCQPTYVFDIPGGHGKVPVGPDYLHPNAPGGACIEDPWGVSHTL
ncbi:MAG: lysine-2,3-aminomutase-like protein, partial [Alphaproteobacteria bacterium]|nr:lysine-2,3-aminomutase-like protein [Alphaproteobacteria bacterium]